MKHQGNFLMAPKAPTFDGSLPNNSKLSPRSIDEIAESLNDILK